jgi:hypothetical protein
MSGKHSPTMGGKHDPTIDTASGLGRRFVLFDNNPDYIDIIREEIVSWKNVNLNTVMWMNCEPAKPIHKQTDLFGAEKHDN